jgi:squalene-hopene/tetraprenyl-beta-curcumene cyclase
MALDAVTAPADDDGVLLSAVNRASEALTRRQRPDGHFVFELEADATIPAEYVLLEHYLARIDPELEARMAGGRCSMTGCSTSRQA